MNIISCPIIKQVIADAFFFDSLLSFLLSHKVLCNTIKGRIKSHHLVHRERGSFFLSK
jgi:hypothetical protein